MRDIFKSRPNRWSIRWPVLIIVIFLLLSFALVGHSLFLARGNHVCYAAECAVCDVLQGVNFVAGSSAAFAVIAFAILTLGFFKASSESKMDLLSLYSKTLINSKIRMNN